ncbi:MarR family transcriptional regulator [Asanoa sp. NPDC050611]|uniref:MarR family winged helix-turn-helix transcriptional regulator n=1 Tax=Asanoa sp. NPDC050611 TaxID=3157098 RepID=UPI0034061018
MDDDTATGRLLWHVTLRWRAAVDRAVAPLGLTHAQYSLIASLYGLTRRGGQPTQRELAEFAELEPIYVSKLVRALADSGLVTRTAHPTDARAVQLGLTEQGLQVTQAAIGVVHALQHDLTQPIGGPASPRNRQLIAILKDLLGAPPGQPDGSQAMTTTPTLTGQDVAEAQGALGALLDHVLANADVSGTEYVTFRVITARGPWATHRDLSSYLAGQPQLRLDPQAAAALCAGLVQKGLVSAGEPVALTDGGARLFADLSETVRRTTTDIYAGLDPADLATAHNVLATLTDRARRATTPAN